VAFTIIIPIYNELNYLPLLFFEISQIVNYNVNQIILVDNNSTDGSLEYLKKFKEISQINFEIYSCLDKGKSNAVRSVLPDVKNKTVLLFDADLEYNLLDSIKLTEIHKKTNSNMTIGVRKHKLLRSKIANLWIKSCLKLRYGAAPEDILTGSRVIEISLLKKINGNGFTLETEITKLILKNKMTYNSIHCRYFPRLRGKKIKWTDLFKLTFTALK
jgi:glycosyltransferase involved in cell wall biosynthesis